MYHMGIVVIWLFAQTFNVVKINICHTIWRNWNKSYWQNAISLLCTFWMLFEIFCLSTQNSLWIFSSIDNHASTNISFSYFSEFVYQAQSRLMGDNIKVFSLSLNPCLTQNMFFSLSLLSATFYWHKFVLYMNHDNQQKCIHTYNV